MRRGVYIHVTGSDLIRGEDGRFAVLEDNLRMRGEYERIGCKVVKKFRIYQKDL